LLAVPEGDLLQREVYYSGRVQGVGFRYTARSLAERFDVSGFVRNLSDGRVHLVVEGEREEIARFLDTVGAAMARYITDTTETERPAAGRFGGFTVSR